MGEKNQSKKKTFLFDSALINPNEHIPIHAIHQFIHETFDIFSARKFDPNEERNRRFFTASYFPFSIFSRVPEAKVINNDPKR